MIPDKDILDAVEKVYGCGEAALRIITCYSYPEEKLQPIKSAREFVDEIEKMAKAWKSTKDETPTPGVLIVKRWKNGSVWAGVYAGGSKDSSFDEWIELPEGEK